MLITAMTGPRQSKDHGTPFMPLKRVVGTDVLKPTLLLPRMHSPDAEVKRKSGLTSKHYVAGVPRRVLSTASNPYSCNSC